MCQGFVICEFFFCIQSQDILIGFFIYYTLNVGKACPIKQSRDIRVTIRIFNYINQTQQMVLQKNSKIHTSARNARVPRLSLLSLVILRSFETAFGALKLFINNANIIAEISSLNALVNEYLFYCVISFNDYHLENQSC